MNRLQLIQQAVEQHFNAKETRRLARAAFERRGYVTIDDDYAGVAYNPSQDAAMRMLQSLLPLIYAAVAWNSETGMKLYCDTSKIETEVHKLLSEVE